ncbi:MAG: hypothetical protein ACXVGN_06775 [Mycobacteriaceae bacterium]
MAVNPGPLDVQAIRNHSTFPELGRIVKNNAASTQPPRELVALHSCWGIRIAQGAAAAGRR